MDPDDLKRHRQQIDKAKNIARRAGKIAFLHPFQGAQYTGRVSCALSRRLRRAWSSAIPGIGHALGLKAGFRGWRTSLAVFSKHKIQLCAPSFGASSGNVATSLAQRGRRSRNRISS